jgi:transketolase
MLLYALLHLTGYDVSLDEIKRFRQLGSKTPGHPENDLTPGVEMATGPLGQGFATAVGMGIAEAFLAATFNRDGFAVIDHFTYVICSDGDLMEGIANEAASLAGHLRLGKLLYLYDDNQVTIDGSTDITFTENVAKRFEALNWHVQSVDGLDLDAVDAAIRRAKEETGRPSLICCKTVIAYGSPNKAGSSKAHGAPLGAEEVRLTKQALGLPDEEFWVPEEVRAAYEADQSRLQAIQDEWQTLMARYEEAYPAEGALLRRLIAGDFGSEWKAALPSFADATSTRQASHRVINALAPHLPTWLGGSADLAESVFTTQTDSPYFGAGARRGKNIAYGVREHAMAASVNGITLHGGCRAFGGTFLIFSDYCKPAIRLAALMKIPAVFVFSHDSIGLGEDGPTHQPVEQLMGLRAIPNLNVMRPADGNETAACWKIALESEHTPCALVLSRQNLPCSTPADVRDHPARFGAYVLVPEVGKLDCVLIATGSEVALAIEAAELLAQSEVRVRVVSMPSWYLFERQPEVYREQILPAGVPTISVEAGATLGWSRYAQVNVGLDRFGASAPGPDLMRHFGFTAERVAEIAREMLGLSSR